jgi:hypothetical protein
MNGNANATATEQEKVRGFKLHESLERVLSTMQANGGTAALINGMFLLRKGGFLCSVTDMFELRGVGFVRQSPDELYRLTRAAREYLGIPMEEGTSLTPEQLGALRRFAGRNGRTWKSTLQGLWASGADARDPDGPLLRGIRNELGATWLTRFKLPQPA